MHTIPYTKQKHTGYFNIAEYYSNSFLLLQEKKIDSSTEISLLKAERPLLCARHYNKIIVDKRRNSPNFKDTFLWFPNL